MVCAKCGSQNPLGVHLCQKCGEELVQIEVVEVAPNRTTAAIFAFLVCWPLGIPALINASRTKKFSLSGNIPAAILSSDRARKWIRASFIATPVWIIAVVSSMFLFSPIYRNYVEAARAYDAKTCISTIHQGAELFYQDEGRWPDSVDELLISKYIGLPELAKNQWKFSIMGKPMQQIQATSTANMKDGAGHTITYNVADGTWSGYGLPQGE
jgi:Tfp pilus assembly protein PilE